MKKFIILILLIMIILLSGCNADKVPRVDIVFTGIIYDTIYLPLRPGHQFAEVPYGIEETENGYNIIIYCVKENK